MKVQFTTLLVLVALNSVAVSSTDFVSEADTFMGVSLNILNRVEDMKEKAFKVLETKCNVCHRKKNPFMIFNRRNMGRRAPKIHKAVFVARRMPKGDEVRLSAEEYRTLKEWLSSQTPIRTEASH
jgi:uncharacterized membrane protein